MIFGPITPRRQGTTACCMHVLGPWRPIPIPCLMMHAAALPSHACRCARSQASELFGAARSFPDARPSDFPAPPRVDRAEGWAPDALCIRAAPNFVPGRVHLQHCPETLVSPVCPISHCEERHKDGMQARKRVTKRTKFMAGMAEHEPVKL